MGNRWQQVAPQGGPAPQYNFDSNNHISGSGITYDALGNILTDGLGNSYTWDAESRLISINGGARTYIYGPLGRRVAEKQNGTLIAEFLYDLSGNKLSSFDGSGNAVAEEIYAGGRHLATYLNSTNSTYFHHTDWLGSLRTDTGVSGTSTQTCTGLPFGDGSSCSGTFSSANLFTDDFHDAEDNLEHTLFRQLSTTQGRWMTPDPSGMAAVNPTNPQTLNMYAYVRNGPIAGIDPQGLKQCNPDKPDASCIIDDGGGGGGGVGAAGCIDPFTGLDTYCGFLTPFMVGSEGRHLSIINDAFDPYTGQFLNSATVTFSNGQSVTFNHLNNSQLADLASLDGSPDQTAMSALVEMGLMRQVNLADELRKIGVILDFAGDDGKPVPCEDQACELARAMNKTGVQAMANPCTYVAWTAVAVTVGALGVAFANAGEITTAAAENTPTITHQILKWWFDFSSRPGKPGLLSAAATTAVAAKDAAVSTCNQF